VLGLALGELRSHRDLRDVLRLNPKAPGRPAITGRQGDAVSDFLSLSSASKAENFTKYPHLTLGIVASAVEAVVTVPNSVNSTMRRNLIKLGEQGFKALTLDILANMNPLLRRHKGATPWFRGVQRRYPSQRATPFMDARIDFDLRTAITSGGPPKAPPRWLSAAYGSFADKITKSRWASSFATSDAPSSGKKTPSSSSRHPGRLQAACRFDAIAHLKESNDECFSRA
jgi:hypothetical protein